MARPVWQGTLSFGLVAMSVEFYSAVDDHQLGFRQIDRDTQRRVRYRKVAEGTDDEVSPDRIVKGYEVERGKYVIVEAAELAGLAPARSSTLAIGDFVDLADIDPIYFASSFYVAPQRGAERPYQLLRDAMAEARRVAVGEFVMRQRQYLAAVRADGDVLVLSTLHFADEIRDASAVLPTVPATATSDARELGLAKSLIDQMTVPWEPDRYRDTYRDRVYELVQAKARGSEIAVSEDEQPAPVLDLMEALRRSVERRGDGTGTEDDAAPRRETVEELRARAKELNIAGRSRMNRNELLAAIHGSVEAVS